MKVLITGGGTAGHINPGIAIAKYILQKEPKTEILFVGTQKGLESKLVPREGFPLETIQVKGFRRKLSLDTLSSFKALLQGIFEARRVLKRYKPDLVIGTGGYVCGPVVFMASRMKIPTLIHEQNAFPGVTNKILSRFTHAVAISFKESKDYFKHARRLVHTGNPVRTEMISADRTAARQSLGISQDKPLVVVVGGSRGAGKINETVAEMLMSHYQPNDFDLIFATGENQYDEIAGKLENRRLPSVQIKPYIFDAANTYAAADLVICRAGAITVSELEVLGTPSIMIPSPNVTANHQEFNARALEKEGGAVVILERELTPELLYQQVMDLLRDKEQLAKMSRSAKKTGISNASEKIYAILQEIIKK